MAGKGKFSPKRGLRVVRAAATKRALDLGTDLKYAFTTYINSPRAILALALVLVLAYTHSADKAEGIIHSWAKKYPANTLIQYASVYFEKMIGMLAFLPTFLIMPARSSPVLSILAILACIVCMPSANFYQYVSLSLIVHVFVNARIPSTRLIALLGMGGYVLFLHETLKTAPSLAVAFKQLNDKIPAPANSRSSILPQR